MESLGHDESRLRNGPDRQSPGRRDRLRHRRVAIDAGNDIHAVALIDFSEATTAIETTKETLFEAEVQRAAGEIVLLSPEPDAAKAEMHFDRALAVARAQQAKSWELRAAMSMARLWRDQGKRDAARDLLAPVYGWFTEGFDTRDLIAARALLNALAS
jgi:predicted ATPase